MSRQRRANPRVTLPLAALLVLAVVVLLAVVTVVTMGIS